MRAISSRWFPLLTYLLAASVVAAQDRPRLRHIETTPVPQERAGPIMGPLKCGQGGSIYLRFVINSDNLTMNPVVRVSSDGKRTARFSPNAISGLDGAGILDFAPGAHGDMYLLTTGSPDNFDDFYLATFDESGAFVSKTKLQSGMSASQLAVFGTGEFLISGRERTAGPKGPIYGKAFTGIFDPHGLLITRVEPPGDVQPKADAAADDIAARAAERDYGRALSLSTAETSSDGRVYLMRFGTDAPIFAITPSGDVTPIQVKIPAGTYLNSVKVDGSRMVTMFIRKEDPKKARIAEVIFSLWDLNTEERIGDQFYGSATLGIGLVCYKSGVFTFVNAAEDGHLQLVHASLVN